MPDLAITVGKQEKSNWCYSAVAQAVLAYYGVKMTQLEVAKWSTENDPDAKCSTDINRPQDPYPILDKHGMTNQTVLPDKATDVSIVSEINAKRPVIALVNQGRDNHYVLIKGYDEIPGATARKKIIKLHIVDPENPTTPVIVNALDFLQKADFRGLLFTKDPRKGGSKRSRRHKRRRTKRRHTLRMNSHPK